MYEDECKRVCILPMLLLTVQLTNDGEQYAAVIDPPVADAYEDDSNDDDNDNDPNIQYIDPPDPEESVTEFDMNDELTIVVVNSCACNAPENNDALLIEKVDDNISI
jgi:hypothetical protein